MTSKSHSWRPFLSSPKSIKSSKSSQSSQSPFIWHWLLFWILFVILIMLILIMSFNNNPNDSSSTTADTVVDNDTNSVNFHTIDYRKSSSSSSPSNSYTGTTTIVDSSNTDDGVNIDADYDGIRYKNDHIYGENNNNNNDDAGDDMRSENFAAKYPNVMLQSQKNAIVNRNYAMNVSDNRIGSLQFDKYDNDYTKLAQSNPNTRIYVDGENHIQMIDNRPEIADDNEANAGMTNMADSTNRNKSDEKPTTEKKPIKASWHVVQHDDMFKDVYLNYQEGDADSENHSSENDADSKILSRKRRYLTFPEGSSFQLVWDGIVPIVDYNNYLILGITVALAWALPSDPPSEIIENVVSKLNNGTLGLQRNDVNVSDPVYRYDAYYKTYDLNHIVDNPDATATPTAAKQTNFPYDDDLNDILKQQPFSYRINPPPPPMNYDYFVSNIRDNIVANTSEYQNKLNSNKLKWSRISEDNGGARQNQYNPYNPYRPHMADNYRNFDYTKWQHGRQNNPYYYNADGNNNNHQTPHQNANNKHIIIPVFGKRKKRDTTKYHFDPMQIVDILYHRKTRFSLFGKLEKFLDELGQNGTECLLKTLCETGQREYEADSDDVVGDLVHALFTIPQPIDQFVDSAVYNADRKYMLYDAAHADERNCTTAYPNCVGSVWDEDF